MCTLCVILANTLVHPLVLSSRTQGVPVLLLLPMCVVDYVYESCSSLFAALCRLMAAHSEFIVAYTKNCVISNVIYSTKLVTASTRLLYITIRWNCVLTVISLSELKLTFQPLRRVLAERRVGLGRSGGTGRHLALCGWCCTHGL